MLTLTLIHNPIYKQKDTNYSRMKNIIFILISLLLLTQIFLKSKFTHSKPVWFTKGIYVEYEIKEGIASREVLNIDLDVLVSLGILHKYRVNNVTIYSVHKYNITELKRKLESESIVSKGKTILLGTPNATIISRLIKERKIPLTIKGYFLISYQTVLFEIVEVKFYWKCLSLNNSYALIESGFSGIIRYVENSSTRFVNYTFKFLLDTDTRKAYSLDNKYVGIVPYWTSAFEKSFPVFTFKNIIINGSIVKEGIDVTPVGKFDVYYVLVPPTLFTPRISQMVFEKVTGLLIETRTYVDPVLKYFLNISAINAEIFIVTKIENINILSISHGFTFKEKYLILGIVLISIPIIVLIIKIIKLKIRSHP